MKTVISKQFTLKARDFLIGLILAVASAVVPIIGDTLKQGRLDFDWALIGTVAGSTFIAYLGKNFLEPTKVTKVTTGEEAKDIAKKM